MVIYLGYYDIPDIYIYITSNHQQSHAKHEWNRLLCQLECNWVSSNWGWLGNMVHFANYVPTSILWCYPIFNLLRLTVNVKQFRAARNVLISRDARKVVLLTILYRRNKIERMLGKDPGKRKKIRPTTLLQTTDIWTSICAVYVRVQKCKQLLPHIT